MEEKDYKPAKHNGVSNVICKHIQSNGLKWQENITSIDISARNIECFDDTVKFPPNLVQLHLSHNKLVQVPEIILNLQKLRILNLSHNIIAFFDDKPKFCHTLEQLDISYNRLEGPPYWIWAETPLKLTRINLSNNPEITSSFINGYFELLLQYSTLVTEVDLHNCRINKFTDLLSTFPKVESLCLGADEYKIYSATSLIEIPCKGLDKCCDIKRLNVPNTHVYTISPSIEVYKNMVEINLAMNDLAGLPNEFCNLENLEICILSYNKILYLPEDICKLQKLARLHLDGNELCMLPEMLCQLSSLKTLDLYDNHLNEPPETYIALEEFDLAQNYFEEPSDIEYLKKKQQLRLAHTSRYNGRKEIQQLDSCSENSYDEDDEELYDIFYNGKTKEDPPLNPNPPSSPEDWDSDDYWVPFNQKNSPPAPSQWLYFVKQKMKEGNFCPMDAHPVPIVEKVKYEMLCHPQANHEVEGQFDDYSSDDS